MRAAGACYPTRVVHTWIVALLAGALCSACREPAPAPSRRVSLTDGWSALLTFRDRTTTPTGRPAQGWLTTPLHAHVLIDGRVLLHGEAKDRNDNDPAQVVMFNDVSWVVDPRARAANPDADATLEIEPLFPIQVSTDARGTLPDEILECGGHTFLADGRLFYAGGSDLEVSPWEEQPPWPVPPRPMSGGVDKSAVFRDGAWAAAARMRGGRRYYPTLTRLADGRVLAMSGFKDTHDFPNYGIEIYDPRVDDWSMLMPDSPAGEALAATDPRRELYPDASDYVHAFLLHAPVVVTPGDAPRDVAALGLSGQVHLLATSGAAAEPLRVLEGSRRPATTPLRGRMEGATSTILPDGRILVAGGTTDEATAGRVDLLDVRADAAQLGRWESFPLCDESGACTARHHPSAVLLPDGRILLVGGHTKPGWSAAAGDTRKPALVDWRNRRVRFGTAWPDPHPRGYHNVAVLLGDGRVFVAGGRNHAWRSCGGDDGEYCSDERPDGRFYRPDYLSPGLAAFRPTINGPLRDAATRAELPRERGGSVLAYGRELDIPVELRVPLGDAETVRVTLVGLASTTHAFDMNQRHVELATVTGGSASSSVRARTPAGPAIAPPGPYFLFVLRTVRVEDAGPVEVPAEARLVWMR